MNSFCYTFLRTLTGFFVGVGLLYLLGSWGVTNYWLISVIQLFTFTGFYTGFDYTVKKVKVWKKERYMQMSAQMIDQILVHNI